MTQLLREMAPDHLMGELQSLWVDASTGRECPLEDWFERLFDELEARLERGESAERELERRLQGLPELERLLS